VIDRTELVDLQSFGCGLHVLLHNPTAGPLGAQLMFKGYDQSGHSVGFFNVVVVEISPGDSIVAGTQEATGIPMWVSNVGGWVDCKRVSRVELNTDSSGVFPAR
jgi:hypothetical protein